ncbi:MAG: DUF4827 domain-containing protein [Duncaniella sp.]|nr:DUF4827 domain-containing protein [Duncaniella sp.]
MKFRFFTFAISLLGLLGLITMSCDHTKSYAELLTDETRAVNAFLAEHHVVISIPEDSVFQVGPNAPYYRLDDEGNVYMQVLDAGDPDSRPEAGERVYFRYMRYSLFSYVVGGTNVGAGNASDLSTSPSYFVFDELYNSQSQIYGEGLQMPCRFLGWNAKVNLVVKSQMGASSEMSYVVPYLYVISYFKPMV